MSTRVAVEARRTVVVQSTGVSPVRRRAPEPGRLWAGVVALERALQAKDPSTRAHSGRVRSLAVATARELGQERVVIREIALAASCTTSARSGCRTRCCARPGHSPRKNGGWCWTIR